MMATTGVNKKTRCRTIKQFEQGAGMERAELQAEINELMRQYDEGEIDGDTYSQRMMELTRSARE